jgi:hypothetical protein
MFSFGSAVHSFFQKTATLFHCLPSDSMLINIQGALAVYSQYYICHGLAANKLPSEKVLVKLIEQGKT